MGTYKNLRTPIIKPRTQGGTFYTFGSALEDIGLNINELRNKVTISHYVLLDLPQFDSSFNTCSSTAFENVNIGDYKFAEGFENYVLNFETVLRNQTTYNFAESRTVSERVFWKWLQKSCMNLQVDASNNNYYLDVNQVVKGFGQISAGAQHSDNYGLYNETFVQIPSSYGQMKVLFKKVEDNNYYAHDASVFAKDSSGYLENIDMSEVSGSDKLFTGISAKAIYDAPPIISQPGSYYISDKDTLSVEFNIDNLRQYYNNSSLTYDDLAIDEGYNFYKTSSYNFNAVLVYYSIYDSTNKNIIATNAYGILLLNSAEDASVNNYKFPELVKTKSTATTSGTSYSFRLNIKATSVYSGDTVVVDNSTTGYSMSTDFNDVIRNLNTAIDIMRSNANYLVTLSSDNKGIKEMAISAIDKVNAISTDINILKQGIFNSIDTSTAIIDTLMVHNIIPDVSFGTDTIVGSIQNDILSFNNAKFNNLTVFDTANIPYIISDGAVVNGSYIFKDNNNELYAKITGTGIFTNNDLYNSHNIDTVASTTIDASVSASIVNSTIVKFDNNSEQFSLTFPSTVAGEQAQHILNTLTVNNDVYSYNDLTNIVNLLLTYVKSNCITPNYINHTNIDPLTALTDISPAGYYPGTQYNLEYPAAHTYKKLSLANGTLNIIKGTPANPGYRHYLCLDTYTMYMSCAVQITSSGIFTNNTSQISISAGKFLEICYYYDGEKVILEVGDILSPTSV